MLFFLAGYGVLMAGFYAYVLLTAQDAPGEAAEATPRRVPGPVRIATRPRRVGHPRGLVRRATVARTRQA